MAKFSLELLTTFRRSAQLQRIAANETRLRQIVKNEPRKIIPVAEVARYLGVSNRQMWNWIDQGWLSTYKRPSESYKKGISKPGFTRFLNRLAEYQRRASWMGSPPVRGRPPTARKRLIDAFRSGQLPNGLTPAQCAKALDISHDSVLRAFHRGDVRSFKASLNRLLRLGNRTKALRRKTA